MWFRHPKYIKAKEQFIAEISNLDFTNITHHLPKVLFICGGDERYCNNRSIIEKYITKHHPLYLTFRAEYAWKVISKTAETDKNTNALALEEWLADFSDIVIILVESYGTVAELGAFSLSSALRKKLLAILDKTYANDESFINTGPVRWIDSESKFKPCIYTDFKTILTCMPEVEDRLTKKFMSSVASENLYGKFKYSKKLLLFFILYLISSLGPISQKEVISIIKDTIEVHDKKLVSFILSIGVALKIFGEFSIGNDSYFTCLDYDKFFRTPPTQRFLNRIQLSRAQSLSKLIYIPSYKEALTEAIKNVD